MASNILEVSTEIAKLSFNKDGTAQGVAKQRMIETLAKPAKRVINDPYAEKFTLGSGFLKFLGHNTLVWMTKKLVPGFHEHLVSRTRFIDDLIEESASNGIEQYVILGAGYDTRAHRLKLSASIKVYEVDQQEVQVRKRSKLPEKLSTSENIIYVDIDFNHQSLKDRLIESGYDQSKSTVFTLEGVSQYVAKKAICSTIKELSDLSKKINAIFYISYVSDLINKNPKACFGKGYLNPEKKVSLIKKGSAKVGEPWISFYNDEEIEKILSENGFTIMVNKTLSDLNPLYFTPVDRTLPEDQIFNLEHSVVAKNSNQ